MGVALIAGALLAKRKRYTAHGICQTTVLFLNLGMIGLVMWPSFQHQVRPALPQSLHKWYYAMATIHSLEGARLSSWVSTLSSSQAPAFFPSRCALKTGSGGCVRS